MNQRHRLGVCKCGLMLIPQFIGFVELSTSFWRPNGAGILEPWARHGGSGDRRHETVTRLGF